MAEKQMSFEDVISGIPPETLNQPCKDEHLCEIANSITEWTSIAPYLTLSESEVEAIKEKWPQNTPEQKRGFLRKWREKQGRNATYRRLCEAFYKANKMDLVDRVVDIIKSQSSSRSPPLYHTSPPFPVTSEKFPYIAYVRDKYDSARPQFFTEEWPPPLTKKVFRLAMVSKPNEPGPVDEELVELLQSGNVTEYMKKRVSVQLQDLFILDKEKRKIVLVEGAPGSGKSTLAWEICQKWKNGELFQEFFWLVVFVELRDPNVRKAQSIADLLPAGNAQERSEAAQWIKDRKGKGVLFVMDGWDEYEPGLEWGSIMRKLICDPDVLGVLYSTLLITSRQISSAELHRHASLRVDIVGFTSEEISQYFQEVLPDPKAAVALQNQLSDLPMVEASCYLPLNAAIVAHLFLELGQSLPKTLFGMFRALVCGCIFRHMTKQDDSISKIASLDELPREAQVPFENVCLLAYEASMKNKATFTSDDLSSFGVSVEGNGLGLLQGVESFLHGKSVSYHFLHLSVQELLAAKHISTLSVESQVSAFRELFKKQRLVYVFRFYAAFTKLKAQGIMEVVEKEIEKQGEWEERRRRVLYILHCLYEAGDASLCKSVASVLSIYKGLDLGNILLSPMDCLCVGYFLRSMCADADRREEFAVGLTNCELDTDKFGFFLKELAESSDSADTAVGCLGLDFRYNKICGRTVHLLCKSMSTLNAIRKLDLSHNQIQEYEDGFLHLLHMLRTNRSLVEVKLWWCNLRITDETGPLLVEVLHTNNTLTALELGGNRQISDAEVRYFADGLMENHGLKKLSLWTCSIGVPGAKLLNEMLMKNNTLKLLYIGWNKKMGNDGLMVFTEAMKKGCSLDELDIEVCGYSVECLKL